MVRRPSPSCAAAKALLRAYFTNRHRSIWRLANGGLPVIRLVRILLVKARPPGMAINIRNNMPDVHSGLVGKEAVFDRSLSSWFSPVVPREGPRRRCGRLSAHMSDNGIVFRTYVNF